ncbi:MAG TPA: mannose-1-phosphate guanylyltransferase [Ornithinibacter sp.]|jgi:mannose-1-phosphate guanylyltransferase|nr:mannose-1-phosphate guanylyltransferase [Ornithinibacter sp.]HPV90752.1 mannose-1-phosphate guanylyltransferase [Ornithinibacter sp.]HQV84186.1 mannose-1-phosphate guanylyltransferase [Ornithinibacter sp.]HQW75192.1 mannose-1-phosphate guanylyltransferase [Ornithinibacter sp.]HRC13644.1 mannose-1-phosphate guanylyltransferase [Dermatophilaceae bacterium]
MSTIPGFWAVVPAGGAGTRLWPLSRAAHPKFLLDLTGSGRTLLQATVDRLEPLTGDRVVVVTGAAHADAVRAQLPGLAGDQVLAEPSPRDSMAAIGLAAAVVERQDPQAVIGSFAADHVIPDTAAFESVIREAAEVAREGHLVTIGIEPTSPATGFGYIRAGEALPGFATALRAVEFVEKPDAVRAAQYVASGEFRWNAGMFVVRAATLLDLLAQWHHELAAGVRAIAASPERLDELWPGLTRIAIDHAVAEPAADAGHVVVVPAPFTWDDVGDFASLAELLPPVEGEPGLRVLGSVDDVTTIDASGIVAAAGGRRVAVVGIEDVVVIDTPDAVLVTTRSRAQDVKAVVDALKAQGRTDLT